MFDIKRSDLFVTPLWEVQMNYNKTFDEDLMKEISSFYKMNQSFDSNIWLSNTPCLKRLRVDSLDIIKRATEGQFITYGDSYNFYHIRGWVNYLTSGKSIPLHGHGGSKMTMCYYIDMPEENGGDLILVDPRGGVDWDKGNDGINGTKFTRIKPKKGSILFWPSFMLHMVEENKSKHPRISLTSDVTVMTDNEIENIKDIIRNS